MLFTGCNFPETTDPIYDPKMLLIYSKCPLASILFGQEPTHTPVNQVLYS